MRNLFLVLIFILGFALRFFLLGEIPALHRDEAFFGYNAYSILETGRDMSGHLFPLHLESFFQSPAGYSYLAIPFIFFFGLSEFSVRIPSALFGALTIPLVYLVTINLFERNKNKYLLGLFSSFIFAISPWHINLSRVATENVVVLFFILLGILLYVYYVKRKKIILLLLAFVCFGVTLLTYQAPRAFLPLFIPILLLTFNNFRSLLKIKLEYVLFIVIIIVPVIIILFSPELSWRISSLSIFKHPETQLVINEQLNIDSIQNVPYVISRIFHNKLVGFTLLISENFFSHLSFDFLFADGGLPDRYRIPNMGLLYLFQLILIIISLLFIFQKETKIGLFLIGWIIAGIAGSALTFDDVPNLQRTLIIVPVFSILTAYGGLILYKALEKYRPLIKKLIIVITIFIILFSFFYYIIQYYIQAKVYRTWYRQDGYEELVEKVNDLLPLYDYAVITNRESAPSIFFLFYSNYDPLKFQQETKGLNMKDSGDISFHKYRFSDQECPIRYEFNSDGERILMGEKNVLYVNSGLCKEIPDGVKLIGDIKRAGGSSAFSILELR